MTDKTIEEMVRASIEMKILEAFKADESELIDQLVQAALRKEVNEHGSEPNYNSRQRMPFLEYLVGETIRNAATSCIRKLVDERMPEIEESIKRQMENADWASAFVKVATKVMEDSYRMNVTFSVDENDY